MTARIILATYNNEYISDKLLFVSCSFSAIKIFANSLNRSLNFSREWLLLVLKVELAVCAAASTIFSCYVEKKPTNSLDIDHSRKSGSLMRLNCNIIRCHHKRSTKCITQICNGPVQFTFGIHNSFHWPQIKLQLPHSGVAQIQITGDVRPAESIGVNNTI